MDEIGWVVELPAPLQSAGGRAAQPSGNALALQLQGLQAIVLFIGCCTRHHLNQRIDRIIGDIKRPPSTVIAGFTGLIGYTMHT